MKAKIRGTEIYFDVAGMQLAPVGNDFEERPVLFLLHGGPGGDHSRFKQHSLAMQEVVQMVFVDHRGCGRSKKTSAKEYTLKNNIEDIEALRKHLGLNKICVLGVSYGGMVAQGYAIKYPQHVEKLILVATAPSYRGLDEAKKILAERGNAKQIAMCEHLWNGTFKNAEHVQKFFILMESMYSMKGKSAGFKKSKTLWSHEALNQGFGEFLRTFDFIPKLHRIKCPTLVLGGDKDWICPPSQSRLLAKYIPHAKLKIFKNCGHAISVDAHQGYLRAVRGFLNR